MTQWFYVENDSQQGSVTAEEFLDLVRAGTIAPGTLIWREGMADWQTYGRVVDAPRDAGTPPAVPGLGSDSPFAGKACGAAAAGRGGTEQAAAVPNYLVWAILATVCCCPLGGIPALVYSGQVTSKLAAGDIEGAIEASRKAKIWCWTALVLAVVANVLSLPLAAMIADNALTDSLKSLLQGLP